MKAYSVHVPLLLMVVITAGLLATTSCKHTPLIVVIDPVDTTGMTDPTDSIDTSGWPCSPDTAYFTDQILPILVSNCAMSGCHSATNPKEGVNLTTYAKVMSTGEVKAGKLSGDFWESINSTKPDKQMPPPPAAKLPQDQIDLIRLWIEQGAKDLTCNPGYGGCATSGMSYGNDIRPILTSSCTGCHSGSAPQGGIDLNAYSSVVSLAQNGKLLGAVKHEPGFVAMPPAGNGLSECAISKVQAWIEQGMLNN
ncbi:MAG: hypothetical protein K9I85_09625 [Saprospiraceae bacterium]|nr:hypothetical protein [Saprospiraceae bacterium]